ncbi:MAG: hypothetical protein HGA53_07285 [Anaerolineaceae bacterium]|nr:hypothetical protein [Anaerolineaceae bacterium]
MTKQKRILILMADAGFGHRSAANAIEAALIANYGSACHVSIVNPLDDKRTPAFLRESQSDYDKIVRNAPELYKLGWDISDGNIQTAILESAFTIMLYDVIRDIVKKEQPDVILCNYPMYLSALATYVTRPRHNIPFYTSVTDLAGVLRLWFNPRVTGCLVPTTLVRDMAIESGMPAYKIEVTGLPVDPSIGHRTKSKAELRADLGLHKDLPTFLAVGSKRVEGLPEVLNVFNHFGMPLQLVVVAGKDPELYAELQQIEWHIPVKLFEYASNMAELSQAADAIISKAGGLIVTESLAAGLPMMMINVIPGQEVGNAEYVINNGAGDLASTPSEALEVLSHWMMDNQHLLKVRAENACKIGRPDAADVVAKILWQAAEENVTRKRVRKSPKPITGIVNLMKSEPKDQNA